MLTDLIELGQKMKKQMKDTQNEIKQSVQVNNSGRKETRTQSNNLEQKGKINIQLEQNEETRIQKSEKRLTNLWDNLKCSNIQIIGVPEGEEQQQEIENLSNNEGKHPPRGKGNRILGSPGSPESPKEVGHKEEHTTAHHHQFTQA